MQSDNEKIVLVTREAPIAIVRLNRPNELNALSSRLLEQIIQTFQQLALDQDIRAVVLTGNGRTFSAGIDLKEAGKVGLGENPNGSEVLLMGFQTHANARGQR